MVKHSYVTGCAHLWLEKGRRNIESTAGSQGALKDGELEGFLEVDLVVKVLSFYEEMLRNGGGPVNTLETKVMEARSAKVRALEGTKADWI